MSTVLTVQQHHLRYRLYATSVYLLFFALAPRVALAQNQEEDWTVRIIDSRLAPESSSGGAHEQVFFGPSTETHLATELQNHPSVQVWQNGGVGQGAFLSFRGSASEHTLVFFDDLEMNDMFSPTGVANLSMLPSFLFSSAQLLKGPRSVEYGSGGIGGVLKLNSHLQNLDPRKTQHSILRGQTDTLESHSIQIFTKQNSGNEQFSLSLGGISAQGISAAHERYGNTEKDALHGGYVFSNFQKQFDNLQVSASGFYFSKKLETDKAGGPHGDDPNSIDHEDSLKLGIKNTYAWSKTQKTHLYLGFGKLFRDHLNEPDYLSPDLSQEQVNGHQAQLKIQHQFFWSQLKSEIKLGGETRMDTLEASYDWFGVASRFGPTTQRQYHVYAMQATQLTPQAFVEIGMRVAEQEIENLTSYSMLLQYEFTPQILSFVSFSTGFKFPTLYQRFSQYGLPDLHAEHGEAQEVGLSYTQDRSTAHVSLFRNLARNMIDFDFATQKFVNFKKTQVTGIELQFNTQLTQSFHLKLSLQELNARDQLSQAALLRRPQYQAGAFLTRSFLNASLGARLQVVGPRDDLDPQSFARVKMPSYALLHLEGQYSLTAKALLTGKIKNLTNTVYEHIAGYGTEPLHAQLGLQVQL